ncbi:DUF1080 domain-containing protein [Blastopirellula sp. J2-11]|uniref:3-keto-disaccharide hydrolase n=1 Tax=Blastopirellula sp. J2-11 TaxID=2943192 RepID=UPI0021C72FBF|nr:DUF1080 domain-containing protein [Blastopirellula sp. J2-11]UUO06919.1 DUF1080 domain-containing protein [Blastopirellula sp. J2-11]
MKRLTLLSLLFLALTAVSARAADDDKGWVSLTDGKSFDGWKINENEKAWSIKDGAFVANGSRSHLFYVGDDKPFKNFILNLKVMTKNNSNGGVYIHTKYQDENWPKHGFECQVNNSYNSDPRKTASLYAVKDVKEAPAGDDEYFDYTIEVKDKTVKLSINGKLVNEYTEPADAEAGKDFTRVFDKGTFALQAHDPGSTVYYKDIRVKRLP